MPDADAASLMLRDFYDRRHPQYGTLLPQWTFYEACYRGGPTWFAPNIFKYHKEGEKEFADRIARSYRFNHSREVVDLVQKYLFKAPIARNTDTASEPMKKFWTKCTRSGLGIDQFMKIASSGASICGRVAVVIDNNRPSSEEGAISVADAEKLQIMNYAYVVMPWDILDYAWDEDGDGELLWIKLREWVRDDKDPFASTGITEPRVRLWTRNEWKLYKEVEVDTSSKGKSKPKIATAKLSSQGATPPKSDAEKGVVLLEQGEHKLGFVPVKLFDNTLGGEPYSATGLLDDIAYLDRAIANYLSNLDAIIQDQTFSQLAIPAQSLAGAADAFDKIMEMGTKRIFTFDGGAGSTARPEYLSPDPKQVGVILSVINKIINEIYSTIGLAGERTKEDNAVGIDNSSGVAKAYDFERVNSLLLAKAQSCEHLEDWIVKTVYAWEADKTLADDTSLVTYPTTFDVARLGDELMTAEALAKIEAPIEVRREQMNTIVDKLFPQISKDLKASLRSSISKWTIAEPTAPGAGKGAAKPVDGSRQGEVTATT